MIVKKHPIGPEGMPHLHPAFAFNPSDPNDATPLSQGMGIGVYYMAKFRGLHNHAMEMNLMHSDWTKLGKSDDPAEVSKRKERYTHNDKRWHMEKAVASFYEEKARERQIASSN